MLEAGETGLFEQLFGRYSPYLKTAARPGHIHPGHDSFIPYFMLQPLA
jgi:hypothetical protein